MTIPQAALPSAIEQENRISVLLNSAGSQSSNPIAGSNRWDPVGDAYIAGQGMNIRLVIPLADSAERIRGASAQTFSDVGVLLTTTNLKSLFTTDTTTLKATANLVAGRDITSSASGTRSIITIITTRRRRMTAQVWVRDVGTDCVLLGGTETTAVQPYTMAVADIAVARNVPVSFFASWNDEVGRQHGASSVTLSNNVVKPYGGAKTVEIYQVGAGPVYTLFQSESPVEDINTMVITPAGDGVLMEFQFRFRSETGSSDYVVCPAWIKFEECVDLAPADEVCTMPSISGTPGATFPPTNITLVIIDPESLIGITTPATIHVKPLSAQIEDSGSMIAQSVSNHFIDERSEVTDVITSAGNKTVDVSSMASDTHGYVIWVENSNGASPPKIVTNGGSAYADGIKKSPAISGSSNVGDVVSFTLDDDGGATGNLDIEYVTYKDAGDVEKTRTLTAEISNGTGARVFTVDAADTPFDVVAFVVKNGQAASNLLVEGYD